MCGFFERGEGVVKNGLLCGTKSFRRTKRRRKKGNEVVKYTNIGVYVYLCVCVDDKCDKDDHHPAIGDNSERER